MAKRGSDKAGSKSRVPPKCNCILLCDDVLISQGRAKHTLQGIIGTIVVGKLPIRLGGYVAYIRVQSVHGPKMLEVSLEEARTDRPVFQFRAEIPDRKDPLGVHTLCVPIIPFDIERDGIYWFVARNEGVILAQSPIHVVIVPAPESPR